MLKSKMYFLKLKRNFIPLLFLLFTCCLLLFSNSNLPAVKNGLSLFANSIVPSLLPFFIATQMLMHTNIVSQLGNLLNPIMKPLFNVRGEGAFAFIMGIISGYPVGAKIAVNLRKNNICSKEECERLLSFTNNSGPLFIIGTIGITMFCNTMIGILLFVSHLLSSICVGIVFRFWKSKNNKKIKSNKINNNKINTNLNYINNYKNIDLSNLGEVIAESITSSISTIFMIGGFIVVFSAIISILNASQITNIVIYTLSPIFKLLNIEPLFIKGLFTGLFEITNGINLISNIHIKNISLNLVFISFLLGFGGISVMLQVLSIVSKTDLSFRPYIVGKLLHGIISAVLTYILIFLIPMFNFNLQ